MKTIEAKVHMLPTENGGGGIIFKDTQPPEGLHFRLNHTPEFPDCVYYHLYITTDEEIKEGDWFIHPDATVPQNDFNYVYADCKKIIATTDTLLVASHEDYDNFDTALPKIPQSFIEEYCKAGGIDEVLVEYYSFELPGKPIGRNVFKPKLNPDNTIIIHPVEEKMYSRDEMEAKCRESFRAGVKYQLEWSKSTPKTLDTGETIRNVNATDEDKWIEENL